MNARRWMDFLLPDALTVHVDWLRQLTAGDRTLLQHLLASRPARLLLTRHLYKVHEIAVPDRVRLQPHQQWLLKDHETQRGLARQLGTDALHAWIRTTVRASWVATLRGELGEDGYRRALAGPGIAVQGLDREVFDAALQQQRIGDYFVALGAALLETTTNRGDPFCRLRMRFAFSPRAWQSRPRGVRADPDELARHIADFAPGD
jgi:hypothetical protein